MSEIRHGANVITSEATPKGEIEDARQQTLAQKFWSGAELFDYACEAAKTGIRMQHPEFSEEHVLDELRRRIELGARLEARDECG